MTAKERAAEAAMGHVQSGMVLGLGTGSTAECFLHALSAALKQGRLRDIRGVPTSVRCEQLACALGIPLTTLAAHPQPDLTVDGADEIAPSLDLIKGLGGALVREKIVAQNSRRFIVIADATKRVGRLGLRGAVPVEVVAYGHESQALFLKSIGAEPALRQDAAGKPWVSDNGGLIYDCRFEGGMDDPAAVEDALLHRAGVIGCGLFLGMASLAIVAGDTGVEHLSRRI